MSASPLRFLFAGLICCLGYSLAAQPPPRSFSEAFRELQDILSNGGRASAFQKRGTNGTVRTSSPGNKNTAWHRPLFSLGSDFIHIEKIPSRPAPSSKPSTAFEIAKDKLAVIVAGNKTGTGFLLRDGKRSFLFTNLHVVQDMPFVSATRLNGQEIKLGARDYARNRDLARFEVIGDYPAFYIEPEIPDIGEPIVILGNSDGRGVVTELRGRVLGVGPAEIEVDAKFVTGNSGSPVLNRAGKVVGIASYLKDCRNSADWSKTGTRFNGIRRFALRPRGIFWYRPNLESGTPVIPPQGTD